MTTLEFDTLMLAVDQKRARLRSALMQRMAVDHWANDAAGKAKELAYADKAVTHARRLYVTSLREAADELESQAEGQDAGQGRPARESSAAIDNCS